MNSFNSIYMKLGAGTLC